LAPAQVDRWQAPPDRHQQRRCHRYIRWGIMSTSCEQTLSCSGLPDFS
jgi:hypothetical protein